MAQEPPAVPSSATEPQGLMPEPDVITRAALFADRHLGKGDLTNGIYVDYGNMIPGAGWVSVGPGYRHWFGKDSLSVRRVRVDLGQQLQDGAGPRRAAQVPQEPAGARRAGALAGFRPRRLLRRRPGHAPKTRCRSTASSRRS